MIQGIINERKSLVLFVAYFKESPKLLWPCLFVCCCSLELGKTYSRLSPAPRKRIAAIPQAAIGSTGSSGVSVREPAAGRNVTSDRSRLAFTESHALDRRGDNVHGIIPGLQRTENDGRVPGVRPAAVLHIHRRRGEEPAAGGDVQVVERCAPRVESGTGHEEVDGNRIDSGDRPGRASQYPRHGGSLAWHRWSSRSPRQPGRSGQTRLLQGEEATPCAYRYVVRLLKKRLLPHPQNLTTITASSSFFSSPCRCSASKS